MGPQGWCHAQKCPTLRYPKVGNRVPTFDRKWADGDPTCFMAEAEAALLKLGSVLLEPGAGVGKMMNIKLLANLGLHAEQHELEEEIVADCENVVKIASGEAGDRVKYKAAVASMQRRWRVFLAVHGIGDEQEPTDEMVQLFCGFMYRHRQRPSKIGRQGLGDSMAEMAQYILAQVRAALEPRAQPHERARLARGDEAVTR